MVVTEVSRDNLSVVQLGCRIMSRSSLSRGNSSRHFEFRVSSKPLKNTHGESRRAFWAASPVRWVSQGHSLSKMLHT